MYLSALKIQNFRQFGAEPNNLFIEFNKGVTALVGENDAGKSSVIDALRFVLQTRDGEYLRLQPEDFHIPTEGPQAHQITIVAKFADLSVADQGALSEYVTFNGGAAVVYIHWTARRISDDVLARRWVDIAVRSGHSGGGPNIDTNVRQLLNAAYLRPLRDATREMSPGRGSRLSQVLKNFPSIKDGSGFNTDHPLDNPSSLSLTGLAGYLRHLVNLHPGVAAAQDSVNDNYLSHLSLEGDELQGRINFVDGGSEPTRLRQILERMELSLLDQGSQEARGEYGLGSNNLLFMACELLLLGKEPDGLPLLLIEEPEAHLHPQRQLRLMEFLRAAAKPRDGSTGVQPPMTNENVEGTLPWNVGSAAPSVEPLGHRETTDAEINQESETRPVQVILTTHSPNLSSKIALENLVLMHGRKAYSLGKQHTKLDETDYRFLARFLDVTKANLFFARGVLIVEGDAEAILLPALAKLLGRDLTRHGISVVNVGGVGLGRYARILQRANPEGGVLNVPVACISDMDVMPDCAPQILGLVEGDDDPKWNDTSRRKWRAKRDFGVDDESRLPRLQERCRLRKANDEQNVKTFVAGQWTLEYDLAFSGMAPEVLIAARLAAKDDAIHAGREQYNQVSEQAMTEYQRFQSSGMSQEQISSTIYALFHRKLASKAIAAQYLVDILEQRYENTTVDPESMREILPSYLVEAITYVTSRLELAPEQYRSHPQRQIS